MASRKSSAKKSRGGRRTAPAPSGLVLLSLGAAAAAGAAALAAWRVLARRRGDGTVPTDLMGDAHPDGGTRAIEAFRPDPTAPVPASERDALRPALLPA